MQNTTLGKLAGALGALVSSLVVSACGGEDSGFTPSECEGAYLLGESDAIAHQKLTFQLDQYLAAAEIYAHGKVLRFKVPEDATGVHFTLEHVDGTPLWLSIKADGKTVASLRAGETELTKISYYHQGAVSFSLPSNQNLSPAGRCLELQIGGLTDVNDGLVELHTVTNTLKNKHLLVPLNVAVPEEMESMLSSAVDFMETVSRDFDALSGIGFATPISAYTLIDTPTSLEVESDTFEAVMAADYADDFRLNVVFVESLSAEGLAEGYSLLGIAGGVPASPFSGTSGSSLLVALEPHLTADGTSLNVDALKSTVIHEIGHMLGLFHTTESDGEVFDAISDTPECPSKTFDKNGDGLVTFAECNGRDAFNLMFWEGTANAPTLTSTQRNVLQNAVLVR